ncbi:hypothetical protein D3C71_1617950 [compost metagenome]
MVLGSWGKQVYWMPTAVPFTRSIGRRWQRLPNIVRLRAKASWLIVIVIPLQAQVVRFIWSWIGLVSLMEQDLWMGFLTSWNLMPHDIDA